MNTLQLFPNRFKIIGWFIFIPSLILGLISLSGVMNFEISLPVIYNSGFFNDGQDGFLKTSEIDLFPNLFGILIHFESPFKVSFLEPDCFLLYCSSIIYYRFWKLFSYHYDSHYVSAIGFICFQI